MYGTVLLRFLWLVKPERVGGWIKRLLKHKRLPTFAISSFRCLIWVQLFIGRATFPEACRHNDYGFVRNQSKRFWEHGILSMWL